MFKWMAGIDSESKACIVIISIICFTTFVCVFMMSSCEKYIAKCNVSVGQKTQILLEKVK